MVSSGAGVFLHNGRRVLLVHQRASNKWGFPKGSKRPHENSYDCWKRELKEETGLGKLPTHKITGTTNVLHYDIAIVELFTDNLPTVNVKDREILDVKWVELNKLNRFKLNSITSRVIKLNKPTDPFSHFKSCKK